MKKLILVLVALAFFSCKKNQNTLPPPTPIAPPGYCFSDPNILGYWKTDSIRAVNKDSLYTTIYDDTEIHNDSAYYAFSFYCLPAKLPSDYIGFVPVNAPAYGMVSYYLKNDLNQLPYILEDSVYIAQINNKLYFTESADTASGNMTIIGLTSNNLTILHYEECNACLASANRHRYRYYYFKK